MKLFMMPQTVPNRPTKGAVAPMVARMPVPRIMLPAGGGLEALQPRGDAFLDAVVPKCIGRHAQLGIGGAHHCGDAAVRGLWSDVGFAPRFRVRELRRSLHAVCGART